MNIFHDLQNYGKRSDSRQESLRKPESSERVPSDKMKKEGLFKKYWGCLLAPVLFIGFPLLFIYLSGFIFESEIGNSIITTIGIVFVLGVAAYILFLIFGAAYGSTKANTDSGSLGFIAGLLAIVVFIGILMALDKCKSNVNNEPPGRYGNIHP